MTSTADTMFADVYPLDEGFSGTTVALERPGITPTAEVVAIVETMDNKLVDQHTGIQTIVHTRNFTIRKDAYIIGGSAVSPLHGDIVKETIQGTVRRFQCLPLTGDLRSFEEEFSDGVRWIVRTKEVDR